MKQLIISLAYKTMDFGYRSCSWSGFSLPIKVLDADGSGITQGAPSIDRPVTLEVPDDTRVAFVRLTWPSGHTETQRIDIEGQNQASVVFSDIKITHNEWSAWAVPKLNPKTPLANATRDINLDLGRFDRTWLRLWRFKDQNWSQEPLKPIQAYRSGSSWQLDLSLEPSPWLLQIGGSKVTWRFVSLPSGGSTRVLITPKDSSDPRADELKVIVTGFRVDAETLIEFLARDSIRAVDALAKSVSLAERLLAEKFQDPLAAVAGGYYLLRMDAWKRIPLNWFENLSQQFAWLPDAAIVHCIRLVREGYDVQTSQFSPVNLLKQSLKSGWPVYSEGIALLQEAAASLREAYTSSENLKYFDHVRDLGAARAWAGSAASFYGRLPAQPSTVKWVGMPKAPRRRSLNPALLSHSITKANQPAAYITAKDGRGAKPLSEIVEKVQRPQKDSTKEARALPKAGHEVFLLGSIT